MKIDFSQLKNQVEVILRTDLESRNDDIRLMQRVWTAYYKKYVSFNKEDFSMKLGYCVHFEDFKYLPSQDAVSRMRRKFNEKGLYLPTDKDVLKKRRIGMNVWKAFSKEGAKDLDFTVIKKHNDVTVSGLLNKKLVKQLQPSIF